MVSFRFNALGWKFQHAMDRLERNFHAACEPFKLQIEAANARAANLQKQVDAGKASWIMEHDGWQRDLGEELSEEVQDAEDSLLTLRKAFTILLYHEWEKQAQRWFAHNGKPNGVEIENGVKNAGLPVDPLIEAIRLLVNTMKHNSKTFGPLLWRDHSSFFDASFDPNAVNPVTGKPMALVDYDASIKLHDVHIADFFRAARASGPSTSSVFAPSA